MSLANSCDVAKGRMANFRAFSAAAVTGGAWDSYGGSDARQIKNTADHC
jgi:hypothetical protein